MKKIIGFLIGIIMILTITSLPCLSASNIPGDINDDYTVNSGDLVVLRKVLLNIELTIPDYLLDMNGDGDVNIKDLIRLKKHLADPSVVLGDGTFIVTPDGSGGESVSYEELQ